MKYSLRRDVTMRECRWLDRDFKMGEVVYEFNGYTYGCISEGGIACSLDGNIPFFELPENALEIKGD